MKYNYFKDDKLFNKLVKEWKNKYIRYTVVDKHTSLPVTFSAKFLFDVSKHHLINYFNISVIKVQKIHNPAGLALLDDPAPHIVINVHDKLQLTPQYEELELKVILEKFYFIEKIVNPLSPITYNYLFNLALVLEERSNRPLLNNELIDLVESVINKNNIPFIFEEKKTVYTFHYVKRLWDKYPGDEKYKIAFLQDINSLKSKASNLYFEPYFKQLLACNQKFSSLFEASAWLKENSNINLLVSQIRKKLTAKKKVQALSLSYIIPKGKDKNCTNLKLQNIINNKITNKIPFTQKDIAAESGFSLRTIKTYWSYLNIVQNT